MLTIKVLGSGCPNCQKVEENTRAALAMFRPAGGYEIEHVKDPLGISEYVLKTPGLVINESGQRGPHPGCVRNHDVATDALLTPNSAPPVLSRQLTRFAQGSLGPIFIRFSECSGIRSAMDPHPRSAQRGLDRPARLSGGARVLLCSGPGVFHRCWLSQRPDAQRGRDTLSLFQTLKYISYPASAIGGFVLAVCSCTILPLFAGIWKRGAGLGPATFLFVGLAGQHPRHQLHRISDWDGHRSGPHRVGDHLRHPYRHDRAAGKRSNSRRSTQPKPPCSTSPPRCARRLWLLFVLLVAVLHRIAQIGPSRTRSYRSPCRSSCRQASKARSTIST